MTGPCEEPIDREDLRENRTQSRKVEVCLCCQQGCCVRDHKPTSSSPQSTAAENKTSADEPADEKTDEDVTSESNEEHAQQKTGEESNSVFLAVNLCQCSKT